VGNTLLERVSARIGLGTNRLTDTPANHAFLRQAVEAGISFIDSAHLYSSGESEAAIGNALAPFAEGLTVATKGAYAGGSTPDDLRRQIEESLERLRTDTIELFYLHRMHPEYSVEAMMSVIAEYRTMGHIAHVGVSEVSIEQIQLAEAVVPIAAVQTEYNQAERKWDKVVDHCEGEGIVFVPFYPLEGAESPEQALRFLLDRSPAVLPIPGTLSIEHLRSNLAVVNG